MKFVMNPSSEDKGTSLQGNSSSTWFTRLGKKPLCCDINSNNYLQVIWKEISTPPPERREKPGWRCRDKSLKKTWENMKFWCFGNRWAVINQKNTFLLVFEKLEAEPVLVGTRKLFQCDRKVEKNSVFMFFFSTIFAKIYHGKIEICRFCYIFNQISEISGYQCKTEQNLQISIFSW